MESEALARATRSVSDPLRASTIRREHWEGCIRNIHRAGYLTSIANRHGHRMRPQPRALSFGPVFFFFFQFLQTQVVRSFNRPPAPRRSTVGLPREWIPDREASVDDLAVLQILRIQSGALSFECRSRN
jgi:hypothetical protein